MSTDTQAGSGSYSNEDRYRLLTYPAVNPLAQQGGVPAVPGVLLDHVQHDLAQFDRAAIFRALVVAAADVEILGLLDELLGEGNLLAPVLPRLPDHFGIAHRAVELVVAVAITRVVPGRILPGHHLAEPVPLYVSHVPHQPEQRQVRRRNRSPGHRLGIE